MNPKITSLLKYKKILKLVLFLFISFFCIKIYVHHYHVFMSKDDILLSNKLKHLSMKETVGEVLGNDGEYFCIVIPNAKGEKVIDYIPFSLMTKTDKNKVKSIVTEFFLSTSDMKRWLFIIDKHYKLKKIMNISPYQTSPLDGKFKNGFYCSTQTQPITHLINKHYAN